MTHQVIIVVGLPASGKTTLCEKLKMDFSNQLNPQNTSIQSNSSNEEKQPNIEYIIYDDFLRIWYSKPILNNIVEGKYVILNDPGLCIFDTFKLYLKKITDIAKISTSKICVYVYENNMEQCLINAQERLKVYPDKKVDDYIKDVSKKYNISNYIEYCKKHNIICNIQEVYKSQ